MKIDPLAVIPKVFQSYVVIPYKGHTYVRQSGFDKYRINWCYTDNAFPVGVGDDLKDEALIAELNTYFDTILNFI